MICSISVLRFIDLVMMALSALLSFALSVTITAGLNQSCGLGSTGRYRFCLLRLALFGHNPSVLHNALKVWYFARDFAR